MLSTLKGADDLVSLTVRETLRPRRLRERNASSSPAAAVRGVARPRRPPWSSSRGAFRRRGARAGGRSTWPTSCPWTTAPASCTLPPLSGDEDLTCWAGSKRAALRSDPSTCWATSSSAATPSPGLFVKDADDAHHGRPERSGDCCSIGTSTVIPIPSAGAVTRRCSTTPRLPGTSSTTDAARSELVEAQPAGSTGTAGATSRMGGSASGCATTWTGPYRRERYWGTPHTGMAAAESVPAPGPAASGSVEELRELASSTTQARGHR